MGGGETHHAEWPSEEHDGGAMLVEVSGCVQGLHGVLGVHSGGMEVGWRHTYNHSGWRL